MGSSVAAREFSLVGRIGDEPVPGFRLLQRIGRGGSGEVWRAEGPGGLPVALKLIRSAGPLGSRELRNLHILRAIRHPNLLAYFGAWITDDLLILGMELADRSLWDLWREYAELGLAGIPRIELLSILADAARVIDFLHEPRHALEGKSDIAIHHRDIKPQNLLLLGRGVKVGDFGLSSPVDQDAPEAGYAGMTYAYASPETFRGRVTNQSDQYSLAVTYCVLRGGRSPFIGPPPVVMFGHLFRMPDLSMVPEFERPIVERALAKQPDARWPDCRQFIAALQACPAEECPETITAADPGDEEALGQFRSEFSIALPDSDASTGLLDDSVVPDQSSAYMACGLALDHRFVSALDDSQADSFTDISRRPRRAPSSLVVRGIGCILLACFGAWALTVLWASARRGHYPPEPPDPLKPLVRVSAQPGLDVIAEPVHCQGEVAGAAHGKLGPDGQLTEKPLPVIAYAQLSVRTLAFEFGRLLDLASGWHEAREFQAGNTIRPIAAVLLSNAATPSAASAEPPRTPEIRHAITPAADRSRFAVILPDVIEVDAGCSKPLAITVSRGSAKGPILVGFDGLPGGLSLPSMVIDGQSNQGRGQLRAELNASPMRVKVRVTASGEGDFAEGWFTLVVNAIPALAHRVQGTSLLASDRPLEALGSLSRAQAVSCPDPVLLRQRALAYVRMGRPEKAIADYTAALALSPRDATIRFNRGRAYLSRGDRLRAQLDFDTAIRLNPGFSPAYRNRAQLSTRIAGSARAPIRPSPLRFNAPALPR
jgi:serine/threonine protein kinase